MIFSKDTGNLMDRGNQIDLKRTEELEALANLCLLDDDLMTLVFDRNIEATELLLKIILQQNDLKVLEVVAQREYKNPMAGGRSITIDIFAADAEGKVYNIEVQRAPSGADAHRARFHSSMIDTKMLRAQQDFKEIHDSYVIFITASDVMGAGCSLYHINRMVEETGTYFGDGSHIIYVNGSYNDDNDPVGRLMHDFRCTSSTDMFYPVLAKQMKYFKETEGGREIVGSEFRDLVEKRAEERAKEIVEERGEEIAKEIAEERAEKIAKEIAEERAKKIVEERAKEIVEERSKEKVLDETVKLIQNLMETMKMTAEQAMEAMKIPEVDKNLLMPKL